MKKQLCTTFLIFMLFASKQSLSSPYALDDSLINITRNHSDLAEITAIISSWDKDANSPVGQLNKYILDGNPVARKDVVLEALGYAEWVVEEQEGKRSVEQLDKINDLLDILAEQIKRGDLATRQCCGNFVATDDVNHAFDCVMPANCCCPSKRGPRGHRGHRGRRGPTGATGPCCPGATGATGATGPAGSDVTGANVGAGTGLIFRDKTGIFINFKSLIQGSFITITNNTSDITLDVNGTNLNIPNTLVARDETGSFSAQVISMVDGVVSQNLILSTEPSTPTAGNVIKGSSRFIHDFGIQNTFVGIDAGNFTLTGTSNSGFGIDALTDLTTGAFNTAVGASSLSANTAGANNTAVGFGALAANTTGTDNTAVGFNALANNTDTQMTAVGSGALQSFVNGNGGQSVAVGYNALHSNVVGNSNTAVGWTALASDVTTTTGNNTAMGWAALTANTTGVNNTAVGNAALFSNTIGNANTAVGNSALDSNTTGRFNTAVGESALTANTTGVENTALGISSLFRSTTGIDNTAVGSFAMQNNTTGSFNTGIGFGGLINCITGTNNVGVGFNALASGDFNVIVGSTAGNDGSRNVGIGFQALNDNTADHNVAVGYNSMSGVGLVNGDNTAIGYQALQFVKGSFNIGIGSGAGSASSLVGSTNNIYIANVGTNESGTIRIGTNGTHVATFIHGIRGTVTGVNDAIAVLIDSAGQLGTVSSTRRVKHAIQDMAEASAHIYDLRPVTFVYNGDASEKRQFGLIAEEADQVFPEIVVHDQDDQPFTIQYHVLPVLLLNEIQKQQALIQQQNTAIANIYNRLAVLEARN